MAPSLEIDDKGNCRFCGEEFPSRRHAGSAGCKRRQKERRLKRSGYVELPPRLVPALRVSGLMRLGWTTAGTTKGHSTWVHPNARKVLASAEWIAWYLGVSPRVVARRIHDVGQDSVLELGEQCKRKGLPQKGRAPEATSTTPAAHDLKLLARIAGIFEDSAMRWSGYRFMADGGIDEKDSRGRWVPIDEDTRAALRTKFALGGGETPAERAIRVASPKSEVQNNGSKESAGKRQADDGEVGRVHRVVEPA